MLIPDLAARWRLTQCGHFLSTGFALIGKWRPRKAAVSKLETPPDVDDRHIGSADSHTFQISNAIGWIRSNYAETLRIEVLACRAGMSAAWFHRHFQEISPMIPIQYQERV
jgi:methylphosphotriester-DNA--protein-cysteine methyltransferase